MGQYWIPVNLDKKEYIEPHETGSGMKISQLVFTSPNIVIWLLHERWYGDRVAIIGDENNRDDALYTKVRESNEYKNISAEVVKEISEYFNMELIPNDWSWGVWQSKGDPRW